MPDCPQTGCLGQAEEAVHLRAVIQGQLLKLGLEHVGGTAAAEHGARVVIHPVLYLRGLRLRDAGKALALRELAANQLVVDLICAALMGALRVAVKHSHAQAVYSGLIGELGAVIGSECVEDQLPITAEVPAKAPKLAHGFCRSLALGLEDDFCAGLSFGDHQQAFALAAGLAYDAVNLPMANALTGLHFLCAALNTPVAGV